tara:strand:- start:50 stop:757 length:708 start_codon:yes stop_codon:yes gene_type:complete
MGAPKIFWNKSERAQINEALVEVFTGNLNLTRREALTTAQLVLPFERRRKMTDQVSFHEREVIEAARNTARMVVHSKPEPVKAPEPVAAEPVNPLLKIFDDLLDLLADRIAERLRPQMTFTEVKEQVNAEFDTQFKRYKAELTPPKPRMPSILIIGLNGCQMSVVTSKYLDFKFTFMTAEEAVSRNRATADHTILMTKFINHSVQNKYRQVPNLHYCNGGVSDLSTLLHVVKKPS